MPGSTLIRKYPVYVLHSILMLGIVAVELIFKPQENTMDMAPFEPHPPTTLPPFDKQLVQERMLQCLPQQTFYDCSWGSCRFGVNIATKKLTIASITGRTSEMVEPFLLSTLEVLCSIADQRRWSIVSPILTRPEVSIYRSHGFRPLAGPYGRYTRKPQVRR